LRICTCRNPCASSCSTPTDLNDAPRTDANYGSRLEAIFASSHDQSMKRHPPTHPRELPAHAANRRPFRGQVAVIQRNLTFIWGVAACHLRQITADRRSPLRDKRHRSPAGSHFYDPVFVRVSCIVYNPNPSIPLRRPPFI
jgi:hypothetical protein